MNSLGPGKSRVLPVRVMPERLIASSRKQHIVEQRRLTERGGLVSSYEPRGPFGAREIGEGSTLPVRGAVAHAIAKATGVWIEELPIRPEKISRALEARGKTPAPAPTGELHGALAPANRHPQTQTSLTRTPRIPRFQPCRSGICGFRLADCIRGWDRGTGRAQSLIDSPNRMKQPGTTRSRAASARPQPGAAKASPKWGRDPAIEEFLALMRKNRRLEVVVQATDIFQE